MPWGTMGLPCMRALGKTPRAWASVSCLGGRRFIEGEHPSVLDALEKWVIPWLST